VPTLPPKKKRGRTNSPKGFHPTPKHEPAQPKLPERLPGFPGSIRKFYSKEFDLTTIKNVKKI
jgi:hypothetical protein